MENSCTTSMIDVITIRRWKKEKVTAKKVSIFVLFFMFSKFHRRFLCNPFLLRRFFLPFFSLSLFGYPQFKSTQKKKRKKEFKFHIQELCFAARKATYYFKRDNFAPYTKSSIKIRRRYRFDTWKKLSNSKFKIAIRDSIVNCNSYVV